MNNELGTHTDTDVDILAEFDEASGADLRWYERLWEATRYPLASRLARLVGVLRGDHSHIVWDERLFTPQWQELEDMADNGIAEDGDWMYLMSDDEITGGLKRQRRST